jgi:GT2 family glycosyltransferase
MDESLAIVIASKNRPADIARAIASIGAQPTQPDRLIVVDQSEQPYKLDAAPNLLHAYDPSIAGLTLARNAGIALNDCAIVLFLDDDVEVISDIVALIRETLRLRTDAIGVQCNIRFPEERTRVEPPGIGMRLWDAWQRIFWRGFFANDVVPRPDTDEIERVHGCAMAFRARLFERETFDQQLVDYSYGEDWEFSKRARRLGHLYLVRDAVIIHHESPANRYRQRAQLEQRWRNIRYFYDKLAAERQPADAFWLRWWMLGETFVWLRKGYGLPRGR